MAGDERPRAQRLVAVFVAVVLVLVALAIGLPMAMVIDETVALLAEHWPS